MWTLIGLALALLVGLALLRMLLFALGAVAETIETWRRR
jgi:hypothetical protein